MMIDEVNGIIYVSFAFTEIKGLSNKQIEKLILEVIWSLEQT